MAEAVLKLETKFTYADYCNWSNEERWELIDGIPYNMSPAPGRIHQKIAGEIFRVIANYLSDKKCEVYMAPLDVRLPKEKESDEYIDTVVQPDIVVICDESKLDDKGCKGSPDLTVEILSPSTAKKDMKQKLELYERVGVKEYWIVQPSDYTLMVFKLVDGKYGKPEVYTDEDKLKVGILNGLEIDLAGVFGIKDTSNSE